MPAPINWAHIREVLPFERTDEAKARRQKMFKDFDPNGNGYLSLAEVDKSIRDVLKLNELFDIKPVLMRAFQAAKSANTKTKGKLGEHFIEFCEFRLLLFYLRQYFELWQMFDAVDTSDDRRISFDEFKKALPMIERWGVKIQDAHRTFGEIDTNGGGIILFDEFATWALKQALDLDTDDD